MSNPLLDLSALPRYASIQAEHVVPAMQQVLDDNRADIQRLLDTAKPYAWDNFARPLEDLNDRLNRVWGPISHLHSVNDSEALRAAYNACLPLLSAYSTELSHNRALFEAYQAIKDSPDYANLTPAQRKSIDNELRDFHLGGVDLPADKKARYKDISEQLSTLTSKFAQNLLDATHAWKKHITDENALPGLPDSIKQTVRQTAEDEGLEGWLLTLDAPVYMPVMNYCDNRALREEMYRAFFTRASELGPNAGEFDNSPLIEQILELRYEIAQLLGFESYADYSLATKMAQSPQQVLDFLADLTHRARPAAQQELDELRAFAREHFDMDALEMWDIPYYSEKLRHHRYELSQETLRPYFPLPQVINGLFDVVKRLYGLHIHPRDGVEVSHPDERFYEIFDDAGELRGQFYLDPYTRKGKRGGAWMEDAIVRKTLADGSVQTPVAHLCCNFTPPHKDTPSLLTHQEVTTLFHEFGHGLHHMLTRMEHPSISGINGVAWDAVELPSQLMENWCWEREALDLFARHYETGAALPEDLLEKMLAAKNFQAGLFMVRQLEFATFDFRLHVEYKPDWHTSVQEVLDSVRCDVAALFPPAFNRFQNQFQHIFAGGYAAGYYSYKWAEVLSADVFSSFEEHGIFDRDTGRAFMENILEQGGSREPMELFTAFRGREPAIEPLLRHAGMAK
jgi:oligopeptidase A